MNKYKTYQTDSFLLASYLLAEDCQLQNTEPVYPGSSKLIFYFNDTEDMRDLINDYYSLTALVNPQKLANAQRTLKSIANNINRQSK